MEQLAIFEFEVQGIDTIRTNVGVQCQNSQKICNCKRGGKIPSATKGFDSIESCDGGDGVDGGVREGVGSVGIGGDGSDGVVIVVWRLVVVGGVGNSDNGVHKPTGRY
eukprot:m.123321 g.123321  ORF g.123321 m.123321 type:complete len:108 (+) comp28980_c0_seq2:234-557(+)